MNVLQRLQNNLLVSAAAVFLKLTKMNIVSDNADITKQSITANALIVGITHLSENETRRTVMRNEKRRIMQNVLRVFSQYDL